MSRIKSKTVTNKTAADNDGDHDNRSDSHLVCSQHDGVLLAITTALYMHRPVDVVVDIACP